MPQFDVDLFVIGAGSGGVRAARVAAQYGARVKVAEEFRVGGTCVIRGCVPKKLLVYASRFADEFEDSAGFGWSLEPPRFDWPSLIAAKDKEIARLEAAYGTTLANFNVDVIRERAAVAGPNAILLAKSGRTVTAKIILVATGGHPNVDPKLPGVEHVIEMPVKKVTSVMFGGPDLDILYVTSMAKPPLPRFPGDGVLRGALFAITGLGIKGVPEPRFAG